MYAISAPGLKLTTASLDEAKRIIAVYPYAKVRRFARETECAAFLAANSNNHSVNEAERFGDVFESHAVRMEYFIGDALYYNFHTAKAGNLRIISEDPAVFVTSSQGLTKVKITGIPAGRDTIQGQMTAVFHGLTVLGSLPDADVVVPDHSVMYCLWNYAGANRSVLRVRNLIADRIGAVALSLRRYG